MLAFLGLLLGALLAAAFQPSISQELGRYVAMAVVAALDSSLGGIRSYLERTFNDRIFVVSFLANAAVAILLVWVGDQLGVDLVTAVVVVFGVRIFQNVAALRRRVFGG
ncbi:MAG TPA: small basic family protein [Acidimicrobiales bacterium]|nr:small basic family protein [Acidimicrobiales bacterium]